jgi:hypothetical protein
MAAADTLVGRVAIIEGSELYNWTIDDAFFTGNDEWPELRTILSKFNAGIDTVTADASQRQQLKISYEAKDDEPFRVSLPGRIIAPSGLPEHKKVAPQINRYLKRKAEHDWHHNFFKHYEAGSDITGVFIPADGRMTTQRGQDVWQFAFLFAFNHAYNAILTAFPTEGDAVTITTLQQREAAFCVLRESFLTGIRQAAERKPKMFKTGRKSDTFRKLLAGARDSEGNSFSGLDLLVDEQIQASSDAQKSLGPKGALRAARNACARVANGQPGSFLYAVGMSSRQLDADNTINDDLVKIDDVYHKHATIDEAKDYSEAKYLDSDPDSRAITYVTAARRKALCTTKQLALVKIAAIIDLGADDIAEFKKQTPRGASEYYLSRQEWAKDNTTSTSAKWFECRLALVRKFKEASGKYSGKTGQQLLHVNDAISDTDLFNAVEYEILTLEEAMAWHSVTEKNHYTRRTFQYDMVFHRADYNASRCTDGQYIHERILDRETKDQYFTKVSSKSLGFLSGSVPDPEAMREANRMLAVFSSESAFAYRRRPTASRMGGTKGAQAYSINDSEHTLLEREITIGVGNGGDALAGTEDKFNSLCETVKASPIYQRMNPGCWTQLVPHAPLGDVSAAIAEPHKTVYAPHVAMCFKPGVLKEADQAFRSLQTNRRTRQMGGGVLTPVRYMSALRAQANASHRMQKLMFVCEQMLHAYDVAGDSVERMVPDMLPTINAEFEACTAAIEKAHTDLAECVTATSTRGGVHSSTLGELIDASVKYKAKTTQWKKHFTQRQETLRLTNLACRSAATSLNNFSNRADLRARRVERAATARGSLIMSLVGMSEMERPETCTSAEWNARLRTMFGDVEAWYQEEQEAELEWNVSDIEFPEPGDARNEVTVNGVTYTVGAMERLHAACGEAGAGGFIRHATFTCVEQRGGGSVRTDSTVSAASMPQDPPSGSPRSAAGSPSYSLASGSAGASASPWIRKTLKHDSLGMESGETKAEVPVEFTDGSRANIPQSQYEALQDAFALPGGGYPEGNFAVECQRDGFDGITNIRRCDSELEAVRAGSADAVMGTAPTRPVPAPPMSSLTGRRQGVRVPASSMAAPGFERDMKRLEDRLTMSIQASISLMGKGNPILTQSATEYDAANSRYVYRASISDFLAFFNAEAQDYQGDDLDWCFLRDNFPLLKEDLQCDEFDEAVHANEEADSSCFPYFITMKDGARKIKISRDTLNHWYGKSEPTLATMNQHLAKPFANLAGNARSDSFIKLVGYKQGGGGRLNALRRQGRLGHSGVGFHDVVTTVYTNRTGTALLPSGESVKSQITVRCEKSEDIVDGSESVVTIAAVSGEVYDHLTAAKEGLARCADLLDVIGDAQEAPGGDRAITWTGTALAEKRLKVDGHPVLENGGHNITDLKTIVDAVDLSIERVEMLASEDADYLYTSVRGDVAKLVEKLKIEKQQLVDLAKNRCDVVASAADDPAADDPAVCPSLLIETLQSNAEGMRGAAVDASAEEAVAQAAERQAQVAVEAERTAQAAAEAAAEARARATIAAEAAAQAAAQAAEDRARATTPVAAAVRVAGSPHSARRLSSESMASETGGGGDATAPDNFETVKMGMTIEFAPDASKSQMLTAYNASLITRITPVEKLAVYVLIRNLEGMSCKQSIFQSTYKSLKVKTAAATKLGQFACGEAEVGALTPDEVSALNDHGCFGSQRLYKMLQDLSEEVVLSSEGHFTRPINNPAGGCVADAGVSRSAGFG